MQLRTDVACPCATVIHRWSLPGRARHGHGDLAMSGMKSPVAPPLVGDLPGDAEPGANLGAGIAMFTKTGHGAADAGVDGVGQLGHEYQGLDVASGDAARIFPEDAPGERGVLRVLDRSPHPVPRQGLVDSARAFALRQALRHFALAPNSRAQDRPPEVAAALRWLEKSSLPVSEVAKPIARAVLDAISVRQDGTAAGATTIARKRSVFANVLGYAIELEELTANPLDRPKWKPPKVSEVVDRRVVVNPDRHGRCWSPLPMSASNAAGRTPVASG
jgi:hypothetical protein